MAESREKDLCAKFGRIVVKQLPPNSDLVEGIKKTCVDNGIRYGAILTTVGSVHELSIVVPGPMLKDKHEASRKDLVIPGPLQVLSLVGVIFEKDTGEMDVHLHGSFLGVDGKIYGGDLEGKSPVLARLVTVIGEVADVRLIEKFDEEYQQRFLRAETL
jgi:hypothetical protein